MKHMLKPPATARLKLTYGKLLSSLAFKFNLRRYTSETERVYLILAMLLGASVYAYVVGSICSIIASMNMRETEFQVGGY